LKTRRTAAAVAGLVCLAASLAGCHSSGSSGPSASPVSPKDTLVGSLRPLATSSYAIALTASGLTASGAVDPVADTVMVTARATHDGEPIRVQALSIEQDSWAKIDLGPSDQTTGINPAKWLLLDPDKVTSPGSLPFDQTDPADAFDLGNVLDGIITVTRTDAQHYTGTIDMAGVRDVSSLVPAGRSLSPGAANVPFTATLDKQGRLTDLVVGGGAGHDYAFDLGISDYDAAAPVDQPNDVDVVNAPASAYALLRTDNLRVVS
jgi:hypothetical protein